MIDDNYLVSERKLGFFVKIKANLQDSRFGQLSSCPLGRGAWMPRVNTKILTTVILVVFRGLKFESDADIGGKDSFRSGTTYRMKV